MAIPKSKMDELLSRIRDEFDAVSDTVHIGRLTVDFWRPADPDGLVDEAVLEQPHDELEWQPYWVEAWDAGYGIAWELAERDIDGAKVLDLGCGLGLAGSVAAARGAEVVMADNAPPALLFAEANSWPWRDRVQIVRLDWRKDRLDGPFDLILGSDILYDRSDLAFLDTFWRQHLQTEGSVLLSEPTRPFTREFIQWIGERDWQMSEKGRRVPQSDRLIRLVELRQS